MRFPLTFSNRPFALLFRVLQIYRSMPLRNAMPHSFSEKTREGCGCLEFLAGKFSGKFRHCWENSSPIFRQHEMLSLPRFGGIFRQGKWLLENRQQRFWTSSPLPLSPQIRLTDYHPNKENYQINSENIFFGTVTGY